MTKLNDVDRQTMADVRDDFREIAEDLGFVGVEVVDGQQTNYLNANDDGNMISSRIETTQTFCQQAANAIDELLNAD